jgi:membrane protein implicated in regulation of membrane protease activity
MWLLYAAAFLLGAGILLVQLLSGHGHGDVGHGDFGHDVATDGGGHHPTEGPGLMSLRSMTYGIFAFGFVGGTLHVLSLASPGVALAVGLASGAAAALVVGLTFQRLADPSVSGQAGYHEARGAVGRVIVACARGRSGKVRVSLKGQTVDMLATTDETEIPAGAEVVIADVRDTVAHVRRKDAAQKEVT